MGLLVLIDAAVQMTDCNVCVIMKTGKTSQHMHGKEFNAGWVLLLDDCSNDMVSCNTAAGSRLQAAGGRRQVAGSRRQVAGSMQICSMQVCIQPPNVTTMCTYDLAWKHGAYRDGASRAVTVASGLIDQIPSKNGWILAVLAPIDGVHSAGQHFYIVLVQLHHLWIREEADMV